ncbi:hypothetical protein BX600DRAFT_463858 [Xylariales sp. PMI_506]|nr:hypothetical protein BX600DRAFT_463858 [Xylariales sp. PMI_506]
MGRLCWWCSVLKGRLCPGPAGNTESFDATGCAQSPSWVPCLCTHSLVHAARLKYLANERWALPPAVALSLYCVLDVLCTHNRSLQRYAQYVLPCSVLVKKKKKFNSLLQLPCPLIQPCTQPFLPPLPSMSQSPNNEFASTLVHAWNGVGG